VIYDEIKKRHENFVIDHKVFLVYQLCAKPGALALVTIHSPSPGYNSSSLTVHCGSPSMVIHKHIHVVVYHIIY
jgi:hypothetical protein